MSDQLSQAFLCDSTEVSQELVDYLRNSLALIEDLTIEDISRRYPDVVKAIEKCLSNMYLCQDRIVSSLLAELITKLIGKQSNSSQKIASWAFKRLSSIAQTSNSEIKQELSHRDLLLGALRKNPHKYLQEQSDERLELMCNLDIPKFMRIPLANELSQRDKIIPKELLKSIDVLDNSLNPSVLVKLFELFLSEPSKALADTLTALFGKTPYQHIIFLNTVSDLSSEQTQIALKMLGTRLIQNLKPNMPLRAMYHKSMAVLIDDIELCDGQKLETELDLDLFDQRLLRLISLEYPDYSPLYHR